MSLHTIRNEYLTVTVSSLGAELQSIVDKNGVERIWQGDPAFWTGRAPVLFPVAGGFRDDCYELNGVTYPMAKHGIVRKMEFQPETVENERLVLLTTETTEGFPFAYEFRVVYRLSGASLTISYDTVNTDTKPFWFSVGAHEAYATPEGIEAYEIAFDEPEQLDNSTLVGNLIRREPVTMMANATALPLKYEYFAVDALVFRSLKSRGVTLRSKLHPREIRVDFPEHGVLMFWTKPGAGYICIEPWCNAPDFVDAEHRIETKPGFMELLPGKTISRQHTITVK